MSTSSPFLPPTLPWSGPPRGPSQLDYSATSVQSHTILSMIASCGWTVQKSCEGRSIDYLRPCRGSYRILSWGGELLSLALTWRACFSTPPLGGSGGMPPKKIWKNRSSEIGILEVLLAIKKSSICTEHSGVMLKFGYENSWGEDILGLPPPPPPPPLMI